MRRGAHPKVDEAKEAKEETPEMLEDDEEEDEEEARRFMMLGLTRKERKIDIVFDVCAFCETLAWCYIGSKTQAGRLCEPCFIQLTREAEETTCDCDSCKAQTAKQ